MALNALQCLPAVQAGANMGGCACYCGLATRKNKVCWGLAAAFGLMTIVFFVAAHFEANKCAAGMDELQAQLNSSDDSDFNSALSLCKWCKP